MGRTDEIRREVVLPAPIERVWDAVTDPIELSMWFGDIAEIDLRPGGEAKLGWSAYGDAFEAVVVEVDRPCKFSYRWASQSNTPYDESTARLVEMTLEPLDSGTRLTMVESVASRNSPATGTSGRSTPTQAGGTRNLQI